MKKILEKIFKKKQTEPPKKKEEQWIQCECGSQIVRLIPNGRDEEGNRLHSIMCAECGEIVMGFKTASLELNEFKDAWNSYMEAKRKWYEKREDGGLV
jgi:hypothetical protein